MILFFTLRNRRVSSIQTVNFIKALVSQGFFYVYIIRRNLTILWKIHFTRRIVMAYTIISGIYIIRNKQSSRVYVGASKNIKKRWSLHRQQFKNGSNNKYMQADYNQFGFDIFEFKVVEAVEETSSLKDLEQFYIDLFESDKMARGYNLKDATNNPTTPEILTHNGVTQSLAEWGEAKGMSSHAIRSRLVLGWTVDKALETPLGQEQKGTPPKLIEWQGEQWTIKELSKEYGVHRKTIWQRLDNGYTVAQALFTKSHAKSGRRKRA